jgi:hypothetical protein
MIAGVRIFSTIAGAAAAAPLPVSPPAEESAAGGAGVIFVHDTCHENYRTHGGRYQRHFHRGYDCAPIFEDDVEDEYEDCHRDVQRHRIPGYGRVYHRHRGYNCRIEIYEEYDDDNDGAGCVQLGPVRVCPD